VTTNTAAAPGTTPQIIVLDTGGQYCHLIARKIRELGVYAEIRPSGTPAAQLCGAKGLIISGGPCSVYDEGSPTVDPAIFSIGPAVLGICYGQQLMALSLGGRVRKGEKGEYGLAFLEISEEANPLFAGTPARQQIWMSHRDAVEQVPEGFRVIAATDTCNAGAMVDTLGRLYGVQFHPEVVHTPAGRRILSNFVFDICGCRPDWEPKHQIPAIENRIREVAAGRSVFFFVSGGVDSTVAYTLCLRALGDARVRGAYVDTGLMREGETEYVKEVFASLGSHGFAVEDASTGFLNALSGVRDPERKRHIIGEQFVRVQEEILERGHFLDSQWILGQGTIYPDTIESGGSANADLIKTHHNRVPGISDLIASNRLVEPLHLLYKDEVREIGRELGLPGDLLERHPFPGPGLAIRCLCSESSAPVERLGPGWLIPVRSVGVQGDCRTYMPVLSVGGLDHDQARRLINEYSGINRVVADVAGHAEIPEMKVRPSDLSAPRLARLRRADAIVRELSAESGFDRQVWQFPVVLIPLGTSGLPDSVVLRPVHSVDGMTAQSVTMDAELLQRIASELLRVEGLCGVFYDLTHKPPATIEWE